ncbi:putative vesicular acetylcholine transporter-B [Babylonia areolata]|uniref:putative vesicular acetylcholine transporter-B n=1 Tax=Babylonia areolata TaxID=304850 RepID=UPI003FCF2B65
MTHADYCPRGVQMLWEELQQRVQQPATQQRLVLVVVAIALLLDNMLYMVIVPIIPIFLTSLKQAEEQGDATQTDIPPEATTITITNTNTTIITLAVRGVSDSWYENSSVEVSLSESSPNNAGKFEGAIGVLFASKAIVQLCVSPVTGTLIDRIGYSTPMMIGLAVMFVTTTVFAFGESFVVMFLARSLQGIGSAFADTSGLAMIADRFTEEAERTKALGIALAFISFGCLFAPPFGGILYEFAGKTVPFMILSATCMLDGVLLFIVRKPGSGAVSGKKKRTRGTPMYRLLLDPYIAVCAGTLAMSNVSLAFLEPTISLWMKSHMDANEWEMGFIWLPAFLPHIAGVYLTVTLAKKYPQYQWLMAATGLALEGLFCCAIPFAQVYFHLIVPIMGICFGIALVDTAILPMLGRLVDMRHVSVYGSVYAIADIAYSLAYALGPIVAGSVVHAIGFFWLNMLIFLSSVAFAPVMAILRNVFTPYNRFQDEDEEDDDTPTPNYHTYVQNGGVHGKPQLLRYNDRECCNHLLLGTEN